MLLRPDDALTRIGVFYDGGYLQFVSDYYKFHHARHARLSIRGLHEFIEAKVAEEEDIDRRYCHVVDAHYFRGRFSVDEAAAKGKLEGERAFDDVLMRENVVTHYLPRSEHGDERGIDVWLALEAYELAVFRGFNVVALIACDGDYLPLVRKLNALGTCVMLLAWEFNYTDDMGRARETRTAQALIHEATYPVRMHELIDDPSSKDDPIISNLFTDARYEPGRGEPSGDISTEEQHTGTIVEMNRDRYFGIIDDGSTTWLFLSTETADTPFDELNEGDVVTFILQPNPGKPGKYMAGRVTPVREGVAASSSADSD